MIKKIILLTAIVGFTLTACKKDDEVSPSDSTDKETTTNDTTATNTGTDTDTGDDEPDDKEEPKDTIQQKLDNGTSPFELYKSDTTILESLYGKSYEGGVIFYLNPESSVGMVASSVDQSTSKQWGCNTTLLATSICFPDVSGFTCFDEAIASSQGIDYGAPNTYDIVEYCSSSAAQISSDLVLNNYGDWFLPSLQEAKLMYTNLNLTGTYWTSTQQSSDKAWAVSNGTDGTIHLTLSKDGWKKVRSVRVFLGQGE